MSEPDRTATIRDFVEALIAVLAIFFLFRASVSVPMWVLSMTMELDDQNQLWQMRWYGGVDLSVKIVAGAVFFLARKRIAALIAVDSPLVGIQARELLPVLLAAIGAFLFVGGIPQLPLLFSNGADLTTYVGSALYLMLSLGLFFGARGLSNLWASLRSVR